MLKAMGRFPREITYEYGDSPFVPVLFTRKFHI